MNEETILVDYSKFDKSLKHLELQYNNYKYMDYSLPEITREAISESVIQRFETCWDTLWKVLKKYLVVTLGIPNVPNSPKPILRVAAENHLLKNDIQLWFKFANARIDTSHDYNGDKALDAINLMDNFIVNAKQLYNIFVESND